jgi:VIT1/CCC1 family predicted Fe2+/Mn2+ transporter
MSDGLTVPFALTAGLSSVLDSTHLILISGLAEIAAGSVAMGLGGYLAGQTEIEHYDSELKKEYEEIELIPDKEIQEVADVFIEYGLTPERSHEIAIEISQDKDKWVEFMMRFELGLEKPHEHRGIKSGLTIATAYIVGGIIPLSPYAFVATNQEGFYYSCILTTLCLFVFGFYKSKMTGQAPIKGALKVTAIGIVAAATAFFIAKLIS